VRLVARGLCACRTGYGRRVRAPPWLVGYGAMADDSWGRRRLWSWERRSPARGPGVVGAAVARGLWGYG
ncbi:hypothetical protein, partial [Thermogemmatispora sp.]|uniref:hypothetical protein n=1 Tax=Thermogemmatispora sp. TaxID=1968838 RepID=UPI0035E42BC8